MAQTINVDSKPALFMPTLYYSQGDVGRTFEIVVSSSDGFTIPSGATCQMVATKPSGLGFTVAGTVSGNKVTFTTTAVMTDEWGRFPAELRITSGNTVIGTANFYMEGERNPHPDGTTDGSQETLIPELTLLVERAENAAQTATDDAIEAASATIDEVLNYLPTEVTNLKSELTDETNARILLAGRMTTAEGDIDTLETHKVAQPLDEYNQPTDGTDGQSLRTKGDGTTEWADVGLPTDEQTAQAVSDWLDAHPEATTTVLDGSLTEAKFSDALKLKAIKDYVTPEMYGAIGDGVTDDTTAITDAIESGFPVLLSKTYLIGTPITIDHDAFIFGKGSVKCTTGAFILRLNHRYFISGLSFEGSGTGTCISAVRIHDESTISDVKIDGFDIGLECIACWVSNYRGLYINNCSKGILFNEGANIVNVYDSAIFNCGIAIEVYQGLNYAAQTSGLNIKGCVFEYDQKVLNLKTSSYGTISGIIFEGNYIESCANGITSEADSADGSLRTINVVRNTMYFSNQSSYNDYYVDLSAMLSVCCNIIGNLCKNANIKLVKFKSNARGYTIQGNDLQNATFDALGQYGYVENNGALYGELDINDTKLNNVVLRPANTLPSTPTTGKIVFANGKVYKGDGWQYGMLWSVEDIHDFQGVCAGDTVIGVVNLNTTSNMMINVCLTDVTSNTIIRYEYVRNGTTYAIREDIPLNKNNISRSYFINGKTIGISIDSNCNYNVNVFPVG